MCCAFLRYGVEPPVLVKLEKEIELEETLLMTEEPRPAVKTFSVCCQHGGLYQPGVSSDSLPEHVNPVLFSDTQNMKLFHLDSGSVAREIFFFF